MIQMGPFSTVAWRHEAHLDRLVGRLRRWPSEAVAAAKEAVLAAERMPHGEAQQRFGTPKKGRHINTTLECEKTANFF